MASLGCCFSTTLLFASVLMSPLLACIACGGAAKCAAEAAAEAAVPAMFVFGDSLADVGNNNGLDVRLIDKANFPHSGIDFPGGVATGRFSNGFIGIDYIAKLMGFKMSPPPYLSIAKPRKILQGANFASAGSGVLDTTGPGTINMSTQIEYFEDAIDAPAAYLAKSLFLIVTANNDLFEYYFATRATNNTLNDQLVSTLAQVFEGHIKRLYKLGARKFWISGVGEDGCVPFLRSRSASGGCVAELNDLAQQFNVVAEGRMRLLRSQLQGFKYSYDDSHKMTAVLKATPDAFGLKDFESACCGAGKLNGEKQCTESTTYCEKRDEYFFWDWFHPTQRAYMLTSYMAYDGPGFSTPINLKQLVQSD